MAVVWRRLWSKLCHFLAHPSEVNTAEVMRKSLLQPHCYDSLVGVSALAENSIGASAMQPGVGHNHTLLEPCIPGLPKVTGQLSLQMPVTRDR